MDSNSVWQILAGIPIGTVLAWIGVIAAIIAAICTGTIKLYKLFTKYKSLKDENEEQKKLLKEHDRVLDEINAKLDKLCKSVDEQKDVNLKQIRYTIVHTCEEALSKGEITSGKLKSLEEMYDEYTNIFHGNGYAKTLMEKVRALNVISTTGD